MVTVTSVDTAADKFGLNLYTWTKSTCPPLMIPIFSPVLGRNYTECDRWRQNVLARIATLHPALVILGVARHYTDIYGFTPYSPQWLQGLSAMVKAIEQLGAKVTAQWATLGRFDFINVVEAPDDKTMSRVSLELGSRGTARYETLIAIPVDEFIGAL